MTYSKIFRNLFGLLLVLSIFASCGKDKVKKDTDKNEFVKEDEFKDDWEKDCFEFVYPINYEGVDGITTISNDEEWKNFWTEWKEDNPTFDNKPTIVFPFDIQLEKNEEIVTIEDNEVFYKIIEACKGEYKGDWKKECFEFVYPISFEDDNGATVINNDEEWKIFWTEWKDNNPTFENKPAIVFPFEITMETVDVVIVIENEEQFNEAIEDCKDDHHHDWSHDDDELCFKFVFPLSFEGADGTITAVNSWEELKVFIETYMEEFDDKPEFVYPFNITMIENDEVITVSSEEDLQVIIEDC